MHAEAVTSRLHGLFRKSVNRKSPSLRKVLAGTASVLAASVLGASTLGVGVAGASTKAPHTGGTLTVLEGASLGGWPAGLDPVTSTTTLADAQMLDAIYGELFEVSSGNKIIPDLATNYSITNGGKTLTIDLRHGLEFSDGTPLNATTVVDNFERDLGDFTSASNPPWPAHATISAPNADTVVVQFPTPDGAALVQMLDTNLTWIVSLTDLKKLGEQRYSAEPIGAGPFEVTSDTLSTKLVLKKNPNYWETGHPYLDGLTFTTVSSDESALEDLQAHDGQAYLGMGTPQLVKSYKSAGFKVTSDPGSAVGDIELETSVAPFTNIKAREALYYAINAGLLNQKLYDGTCTLSQSFTGPGGLFYEPKVPGYRTYDLAKAKALVKQLGGLSFTLYYLDAGLYQEEAPTLQTMFKAAGIDVTLDGIPQLAPAINEFDTHKWPAFLWVMGSYDPSGGIGVSFFLASTGPFSGIKDPTVDKYIDEGSSSVSMKARASAYASLAQYVSQEAYSPYICAAAGWDVTAKGVSGPGLTTAYGSFGQGPLVQWESVSA
jgi:peptide/nickel transport system substrate-binding protein